MIILKMRSIYRFMFRYLSEFEGQNSKAYMYMKKLRTLQQICAILTALLWVVAVFFILYYADTALKGRYKMLLALSSSVMLTAYTIIYTLIGSFRPLVKLYYFFLPYYKEARLVSKQEYLKFVQENTLY